MLSVIIPARNEKYLEKTIRSVLENALGEVEVLVVLDGYLPDPPIHANDNRVIFIHNIKSIGQRQAVNQAARRAKGKYVMKLDAHCAVDKGFDLKLAADCAYGWTVVPRMYNLDVETWLPKLHKRTDYMYISSPDADKPFRAQYYEGRAKDEGQRQPANDKLIDDTMCNMGPGWFMHKDRFWELGGMDEKHGGWGQMGIEVSCKAWLSGGALKVNKQTWFAHWFRGGGGPGFPYTITGSAQEKARAYSRDLWLNNKWDKQVRSFQWLVDKFNPPGWNRALTILYYSANLIHPAIEYTVLRNLKNYGYPVISVTQKPMDLGYNIVVPVKRSLENIYQQVLTGAREAKTKYVALCEDDCLYTKEHFKHRPEAPFAYNLNRWNLHLWVAGEDKQCFSYRQAPILSQCIAKREELIKCLEAGPRIKEMGLDDAHEYETFTASEPNLVFCHRRNITGRKYIGKDAPPRYELPPYQTVDYWLKKFKKRGLFDENSAAPAQTKLVNTR